MSELHWETIRRVQTILDEYNEWSQSICMDKRGADQALLVHCIFGKYLLQDQ